MTEGNPVTGQPYGGRDEKPDGAGLPGERPVEGDEAVVTAPASAHDDQGETGSRAATEGVMGAPTGKGPGGQGAEAPSPGDVEAGDQSLASGPRPGTSA